MSQIKDWMFVNGVTEEMNYTYDALNRLVRAETTGAGWRNAYTYDGFGNLTGKTVVKGTAPYLSVLVNGATNRLNRTMFGN